MNRRSLLAALFAAPLTFVGAVRGWVAGGERVPDEDPSWVHIPVNAAAMERAPMPRSWVKIDDTLYFVGANHDIYQMRAGVKPRRIA